MAPSSPPETPLDHLISIFLSLFPASALILLAGFFIGVWMVGMGRRERRPGPPDSETVPK